MMSNVAIVTSMPQLKEHFPDIIQIEFLSRIMLTLPSLAKEPERIGIDTPEKLEGKPPCTLSEAL